MGFADRRYGTGGGFGGGRGGWSPGGSPGYGGGGGLFGYALTTWVKRLLALNFGVFVVVNLLGLLPIDTTVDLLGFSVGTVPDL